MLAVAAPDPVMAVIAPVGLAASAGTALIVDMAPGPGARRSRADLTEDGPHLDEISPGRSGVAVIAAGPASQSEVTSVVERLAARWPAVVVRDGGPGWPGPVVPVHVLYGQGLMTWDEGAAVWQSLGSGEKPPGPGPILPPISPRLVRQLLKGWLPRPGRWIRAWREVWEMPWA